VYEKTAWNVLRRLGHNQKTCITKTPGFTKLNDQLKQEDMKFITKMKKENRFYLHPSVIHSIDVTYTRKPQKSVTSFSRKGGGKQIQSLESSKSMKAGRLVDYERDRDFG